MLSWIMGDRALLMFPISLQVRLSSSVFRGECRCHSWCDLPGQSLHSCTVVSVLTLLLCHQLS